MFKLRYLYKKVFCGKIDKVVKGEMFCWKPQNDHILSD